MIVHVIEVRHIGQEPPQWMLKELYESTEVAAKRLHQIQEFGDGHPDHRHTHVYRIRPIHLHRELPPVLFPGPSGSDRR